MHLLDSQISRALVQPTPWEWEQYQRAAAKDKPAWGALIDIGSSHRFCDQVQQSVDTEIRRCLNRRGRRMRSAPSGPAVSELARNEYYQARNLYSWMRADYRAESGGKVTAFGDKVVTVAQGAVRANAKSLDPNHAFSQASAPNQCAAVTTSAGLGNREVASYAQAAANYYDSSLLPSGWDFMSNGLGAMAVAVFTPGAFVAADYFFATSGNGTQGMDVFRSNSTSYTNRVIPGSADSVQVSGVATGVPTYMLFTLLEGGAPEMSGQLKSGTAATHTLNSSTGAQVTMRVGARPVTAALASNMDLADLMFASVVDATLIASIQRYTLLRYLLS